MQDSVPEVLNNVSGSESPSSPISSYDNSPFSLEDFNEKLPELPPLLQQSPLDHPSSISDNPESLEKPLNALLNHLYIQKGRTGQSLVALSSTHRFRTKYVTAVLYKPLKKVKKWILVPDTCGVKITDVLLLGNQLWRCHWRVGKSRIFAIQTCLWGFTFILGMIIYSLLQWDFIVLTSLWNINLNVQSIDSCR